MNRHRAQKMRFESLLTRAFGTHCETTGEDQGVTHKCYRLLGSVAVFNLFVAHGLPTRQLLKDLAELSRRFAQEKKARAAELELAGRPAKKRKTLAFDSDSVKDRKALHKVAKDMLEDAHAMGLGHWFAESFGLWYAPPGQSGLAGAVPRLAPPNCCQAYMHGPFLHGHTAAAEDLRVCFKREELEGVQRLLCVQCRDDRKRCLHPGKVRCLSGFCPAKERADHGNDWGLGFARRRHWMIGWRYAVPNTERQRILDFTSPEYGWPDPASTLRELREATEQAGVGRDMQALIPPLTYGKGSSGRQQLLEAVGGRDAQPQLLQFM